MKKRTTVVALKWLKGAGGGGKRQESAIQAVQRQPYVPNAYHVWSSVLSTSLLATPCQSEH